MARNLDNAAERLEFTAANDPLPPTVGNSRKSTPIEEQATLSAGAAIWGAVLRRCIRVPKIAGLVGAMRASGHETPEESATECHQLFLDALSVFAYPHGDDLFPEFIDIQDNRKSLTQDQWERRWITAEAKGCRMLAELIRGGGGREYCTPELHRETLEELVSLTESIVAAIDEDRQTGDEAALIETAYVLRCFYDTDPSDFAIALDDFLAATEPYNENDQATKSAAFMLMHWAETELEKHSTDSPPAEDEGAADEPSGDAQGSDANNNVNFDDNPWSLQTHHPLAEYLPAELKTEVAAAMGHKQGEGRPSDYLRNTIKHDRRLYISAGRKKIQVHQTVLTRSQLDAHKAKNAEERK